MSIIITDHLDKVLEDPDVDIDNMHEDETGFSLQLLADFQNFQNYFQSLNQNIQDQTYNPLQEMAIISFFRHYMKFYIDCFLDNIENKKWQTIMNAIDDILYEKNVISKNICIYALKLLRNKTGTLENLKTLLFSVRRMKWVETFAKDFECPLQINTPHLLLEKNVITMKKIHSLWINFKNSGSNESEFLQFIKDISNSCERYCIAHIFLNEICIDESKLSMNMLGFINKNWGVIQKTMGYDLTLLLKKYCEGNIVFTPDINKNILILNSVNWIFACASSESPLTSIFFQNQNIPKLFSQHFKSFFIVCDKENPFLSQAINVKVTCRYVGVYICSNECDYIYPVIGCGWTNETNICPFCNKDIGNERGKGGHTLGRIKDGARRIGFNYPDGRGEYYVWTESFQKNEEYWKSLEKAIDTEIERIKEKKSVKINEKTENLIGYNRKIEKNNNGNFFLPDSERVKAIPDNFLRLILHSCFYSLFKIEMISKEELKKTLKIENPDEIELFLSSNIDHNLKVLKDHLSCNDYYLWIMAMQEKLAELIINFNKSPILAKNRDLFEEKVSLMLEENLKDKKFEIIQEYKKMNNNPDIDRIICEEKIPKEYYYIQILRVTQPPSLYHIRRENDLKEKYPILEECIKNLEEILVISKLKNILAFINELKPYIDFRISREEAENTDIIEFINKNIPESCRTNMINLLDKFLLSWNWLIPKLEVIQYQCKTLGKMSKYNKNTKIIAFLVDTLKVLNEFGKILSGVINVLSQKQNGFLTLISSKAKSRKLLKNINFSGDTAVIPQNCLLSDILELNEEEIEELVLQGSSCLCCYGNGIQVYNFEGIQFNLIIKLMNKKKFLEDMSLYQNISFVGEIFATNAKSSDYITQLKKMGINKPIPNPDQLEEKLLEIQQKNPNLFYSTLKILSGSLEKLIIFYKNIREENINLSTYISKHNFTLMSPLLMNEQPFKDYDIQCLVSLYEYVEVRIFPEILKILPEEKKKDQLIVEEIEIDSLKKMIKLIKENPNKYPTFIELTTAFSRFITRCYLLQDYNQNQKIMDWLPAREDFWNYPKQDELVEQIVYVFPPINMSKIISTYNSINLIINPKPIEIIIAKPVIVDKIVSKTKKPTKERNEKNFFA